MRAQMPVAERFAYFDHAAVAPLPLSSMEAIARYADEACRLGDTVWPSWSAASERLRIAFSRLVHCDSNEIAHVPNTTTAIGIVAESFPWRPGDSVVVPANEFPSNLAPWRNLKRRGVEVREVPMPPNGALTIESILQAMDRSTRLVSVSWVGFISGFRIDPARFAAAIHERGALLMLDSIQGLGVFPLDFQSWQIDFAAADGHKWLLGPEGAGLLAIKREHLNLLDPIMIGWHSLDDRGAFDPSAHNLKPSAARYEGGSANMVGRIGLEQSLNLLLELGAATAGSQFADLVLDNVELLIESLHSTGCDVDSPAARDSRSGIVTFQVPGRDPMEIRRRCLERDVVVSVRGGKLRASIHAYNNSDDIGRLTSALR
ncbi:MAG: aminotransferase class V-fold PLP-dependent enzyme [Pirellulales bacterium]